MNIRYRVELSQAERDELNTLLSGGRHAARKSNGRRFFSRPTRAWDERIAADVGVGTSTVYRTKQHFVEDGLARALSETPRPGAPRKLTASDEARLVAVACSTRRPAGPAGRWICWPTNWSASPRTRPCRVPRWGADWRR